MTLASSEPNPWVDTLLFDNELMNCGDWDDLTKGEILDWIRALDIEEKRVKASNLLSKLIPRLLGTACSEYGKKKVAELGRQFTYLESLIITTRTGIEGKFYRDHLNHMIRVMLLTRAMTSIRAVDFDKQAKDLLSVVALMHDLAYPLAEARRIFRSTQKALRECYGTVKFPDAPPTYDISTLLERFALIPLPNGEGPSFLKPLVDRYHHAFIGAMEFLNYLRTGELDPQTLTMARLASQAIAFHDSDTQTETRFTRNPFLAILVLCDEMQDWGRPVGFSKSPLIPSMQLSISPDGLSASYHLGRAKGLRALEVLHAKQRSLRRVVLDGSFPSFSLKFSLPDYERTDVLLIEQIMEKLYSLRRFEKVLSDRNLMVRLRVIESEMGRFRRLGHRGHSFLRLPEEYASGEVVRTSPFQHLETFLDRSSHEILVLRKGGGSPTLIEFAKQKDGRILAQLERSKLDGPNLGVILRLGQDPVFDSVWNRIRLDISAFQFASLVTQLESAKLTTVEKDEVSMSRLFEIYSLALSPPSPDTLQEWWEWEWGLNPDEIRMLSKLAELRIDELSFYAFAE